MHIAWAVTPRCNLYSLHDPYRRRDCSILRDELTDQELLKLAADIASVKPQAVTLGGGEPLLRMSVVYDIVYLLAHQGIKVALSTNGSLLAGETARRLASAGIDRVQVSLDGAMPDTHDRLNHRQGCYDRAVLALQSLYSNGIEAAVSFCPTKINLEEFDDFVYLAFSLYCKKVLIQPLLSNYSFYQKQELALDVDEYHGLAEKILEHNNTFYPDMQIEWDDPFSQYPGMENLGKTYYEIMADGFLSLSTFLPLSLGNVKKHSFSTYWRSGLAQVRRLPIVKELIQSIDGVNVLRGLYPLSAYRPVDFIKIDIIEDIGRLDDIHLCDFYEEPLIKAAEPHSSYSNSEAV